MCQHSHDLLLLALVYEGVVQHYALVLEEAVHVSIAVRRARRAVHHKQLRQRKL